MMQDKEKRGGLLRKYSSISIEMCYVSIPKYLSGTYLA